MMRLLIHIPGEVPIEVTFFSDNDARTAFHYLGERGVPVTLITTTESMESLP